MLKHQSFWNRADFSLYQYRQGMPMIDIAKLTGYSTTTISWGIKAAKAFPSEYRTPELDSSYSYVELSSLQDPIKALRFCLGNQISSADIRRLCRFLKTNGIKEENLENACRYLGVELKPVVGGHSPKDISTDELLHYYNLGLVDQEIADLLGVSRPTILRARQELGLKANRRVGQRGCKKTFASKPPTLTESLKEENTFLREQLKKATLNPLQELQALVDELEMENYLLEKKLREVDNIKQTYLRELNRRQKGEF